MARKDTATAKQPVKTAPASIPAKSTAKPAKPAAKSPATHTAPVTPARGHGPSTPATVKAAAPPPKPPIVTLKHLAAGLSEKSGMPKRDAESFAAQLFGDLIGQVRGGAKVRIAGLGVIELKDRPARMARNPATGAPVQVAASRKIVFRAAKELKEAI